MTSLGVMTVNVQHTIAIGTKQLQEFEKGWPEGFQSTISKKVKTVSAVRSISRLGRRRFTVLQ